MELHRGTSPPPPLLQSGGKGGGVGVVEFHKMPLFGGSVDLLLRWGVGFNAGGVGGGEGR